MIPADHITFDGDTLPARIAAKIDASGDCWLWTAGCGSDGYGALWWEGAMCKAHRVVREILVGPIPSDMQCDHLCRVRHCVNPDHIEVVAHVVNGRRGISGKANRNYIDGVLHCRSGRHRLDEPGSMTKTQRCRQCLNEQERDRMRRNYEART